MVSFSEQIFYDQTELYILTKHINQFRRNLPAYVVVFVVIDHQSPRLPRGPVEILTEGGLGVALLTPTPTHPTPLLQVNSLGP